MKRRWTEEEIWNWYKAHDWISGFNFIPSGSMTGSLWLFQEYNHKDAFNDAAKEISLAASLGFNSIRMTLPFRVWQEEHDGFFNSLDQLLNLLSNYNMTLMPVIFGDCLVPKERYNPPAFGPQPEPVPGYFGGSPANPFEENMAETKTVGYSPIADEPEMEPIVHRFINELAAKYGRDERIIIWNIWNEAGNSCRGSMSLPMMEKVFGWLRDNDVSQPLTADVWVATPDMHLYNIKPGIYEDVEARCIKLSDIITFHYYGDYLHSKQYIKILRQFGRPLINTEWLHRPFRSLIQTHMPLWKKEGIGSYFFGFVNGKSQFNNVWGHIKDFTDIDTELWMHDIFHSDFTPYDPEEIEVAKECNRDKTLVLP